jgi:putative tryptophan/tyrosine transport system substrate-binding protein
MKRRSLLVGMAISIAAPRLSVAQHPRRVPRVAFVAMGRHPAFDAFAEQLRQLGYRDGEAVVLEPRFTEPGRTDQFDDLMADLVRTKVDIIVALINPEIAAARKATSTIPIVMVVGVNPVQQGFVESLARPGGNVTGLTWDPDPEIYGKLVEAGRSGLSSDEPVLGCGRARRPPAGDSTHPKGGGGAERR